MSGTSGRRVMRIMEGQGVDGHVDDESSPKRNAFVRVFENVSLFSLLFSLLSLSCLVLSCGARLTTTPSLRCVDSTLLPVYTETCSTYTRRRVESTHGVFQRVTHHTHHTDHPHATQREEKTEEKKTREDRGERREEIRQKTQDRRPKTEEKRTEEKRTEDRRGQKRRGQKTEDRRQKREDERREERRREKMKETREEIRRSRDQEKMKLNCLINCPPSGN